MAARWQDENFYLMCCRVVGQYPVRVAENRLQSYQAKKRRTQLGRPAAEMMRELLERLRDEDLVQWEFQVLPMQHGRLWSDASSLELEVALEISGTIVEDAAWLRKKKKILDT